MYEYTYPAGYQERFGASLPEGAVLDDLRATAASGDERDIIPVAAAVVHRHGAVRALAQEALGALFERAAPTWLATHAAQLRGIASHHVVVPDGASWLSRASWIARRLMKRPERPDPDLRWSGIALLTFAGDGYVREAAVRALSGTGDVAIPFLLLRRNDWVPQVRKAAALALDAYSHVDRAQQWIRCLPLVDRLAIAERDDHAPFVARVHTLLLADENRDALLEATTTAPRETRRAAARLVLRGSGRDAEVDTLLMARDAMIRLWAGRHVLGSSDLERRLRWARRLVGDRFAPLAAEALDVLTGTDPDAARPHLRSALLSRRAVQRRVAVHHLRRLGEDVEAVYAQVLLEDDPQPALLATAVEGFGVVSSAAEADVPRHFLDHADHRVRRGAIRALARLARNEIAPFIAALGDPAPSVCKVAAANLTRRPGALPLDELAEVIRRGPLLHNRRIALGLAARGSPSACGALLIETAATCGDDLRDLALLSLSRWGGRISSPAPRLPEPLVHALRADLRRHEADLPQDLLRSLRARLVSP